MYHAVPLEIRLAGTTALPTGHGKGRFGGIFLDRNALGVGVHADLLGERALAVEALGRYCGGFGIEDG